MRRKWTEIVLSRRSIIVFKTFNCSQLVKQARKFCVPSFAFLPALKKYHHHPLNFLSTLFRARGRVGQSRDDIYRWGRGENKQNSKEGLPKNEEVTEGGGRMLYESSSSDCPTEKKLFSLKYGKIFLKDIKDRVAEFLWSTRAETVKLATRYKGRKRLDKRRNKAKWVEEEVRSVKWRRTLPVRGGGWSGW